MFSRISGTLVEKAEGNVVLDVGGLSYDIILPPCVEEKVTIENGEQLTLEVYSVMNMEGNTGHFTFYGFSNAIERGQHRPAVGRASVLPADEPYRRRNRSRGSCVS
jgi:Holliday junction resolvasome RuvABC DNA-binding subunit